MSDGVVFLPSFYEAIADLPDPQRLQMYDAIIVYGLYGEIKDLNPVMRSFFALMKPVIDSSQRRHKAAKENGKKGGRPPKNQTENQIKNQTENQTENQDIDIDIDSDIDTDIDSDKEKKPPRKKYGVYGWVRLTDDQYDRLYDDLGQLELERCIQYIDESAQQTGNKNKWKDWNLVIRRCSREGWGRNQLKTEPDWNKGKVIGWSGNV